MKPMIQPSNPDSIDEFAERQRIRVTYEKGDSIKFISHQDEFRAWERALRRANLPILYKRGFNPQPHIQFASPLGVGFSGIHEYVDITLSPPMSLEDAKAQMKTHLPPGLTVHSLQETPLKGPALQTLLIGADYTLSILAVDDEPSANEIETAVRSFLDNAEEWRTRERKGRTYRYNLRPLVLELRYIGASVETGEHKLFLRVQQREGATGRPDEVISALGLDKYARRLQRDRLFFSSVEEDVAQFSQYPVVSKADIAGTQPSTQRRRKKGKPKRHIGRTINQRAADEIG